MSSMRPPETPSKTACPLHSNQSNWLTSPTISRPIDEPLFLLAHRIKSLDSEGMKLIPLPPGLILLQGKKGIEGVQTGGAAWFEIKNVFDCFYFC